MLPRVAILRYFVGDLGRVWFRPRAEYREVRRGKVIAGA